MKKKIGMIIGITVLILLAVVVLFIRKKEQREVSLIGGSDGPTSIFIAGKVNDEFYDVLSEEGIAPYELTGDVKAALDAFGMTDITKLFIFREPKEAVSVEANVYRLTDEDEWDLIGNGTMSIKKEEKMFSQSDGSIAIALGEKHKISMYINCGGQLSFSTEEIIPDAEIVGSTKGYLEEFRSIELNKEIPLAVMVYDSGNEMRSFTPQDYYEPSVFWGMDLVQLVTVEFSDRER